MDGQVDDGSNVEAADTTIMGPSPKWTVSDESGRFRNLYMVHIIWTVSNWSVVRYQNGGS